MLRYMLALELEKAGEHDESLQLLQNLMADETPYVPAYLMAGQQLAGLGRIAEARDTYTKGIAQAGATGDDHAAAEMAQFRSDLSE